MSAVAVTVQALLGTSSVTSIVGSQVWPIEAEPRIAPPYCVVNLISEPDEQMLGGPGLMFEARISIESIHTTRSGADLLGEAIKDIALLHNVSLAGKVASFAKQGMDETDAAEDRSTFRRITDYVVRWR